MNVLVVWFDNVYSLTLCFSVKCHSYLETAFFFKSVFIGWLLPFQFVPLKFIKTGLVYFLFTLIMLFLPPVIRSSDFFIKEWFTPNWFYRIKDKFIWLLVAFLWYITMTNLYLSFRYKSKFRKVLIVHRKSNFIYLFAWSFLQSAIYLEAT